VNFKPLSKQDAMASQLFPKGAYRFEVLEATDKESRAGNPMIELKLKVTDSRGVARFVTDYLLEQWPIKLRHAAEACGLIDQYDAGELTGQNFVGKTGRVMLGIQKDKAKKFPDKNVVLDYVVPLESAAGIRLLQRKA